jgi:hypothetical protein
MGAILHLGREDYLSRSRIGVSPLKAKKRVRSFADRGTEKYLGFKKLFREGEMLAGILKGNPPVN